MKEVLGLIKPVGFDQKILLHHLDYTAKQSRKYSKKDMYALLDGYLRQDIAAPKSRKNTITILMKIWYNVPEGVKGIREKILDEFNEFTKDERLFAHWNMTMLAYPFFKDVVLKFGRLFQLQNSVNRSTIVKRMKNSYGERVKVEVASSAVITTLKAWGIIVPSERSSYHQNEKVPVFNLLLQELLLHTMLHVYETDTLYMDTIVNHPLLFPFEVDLQTYELMERTDEFTFHYQGMEKLIVEKM